MIYQLAKTIPGLTGQVKMNFTLNGDTVTGLEYTPISKHIIYTTPNNANVLNLTHAENIKCLYNKIDDKFFSAVQNPEFSVKQIHRYTEFPDDTHDGSYEMSLRRAEYLRYNKQFEFFCPFWISNINEFKFSKDDIEFMVNFVNKAGRVMYSKKIKFAEKITNYLHNIFPSLNMSGENTDLVYIDFNKMESHIKGLNPKTGNVMTIDTSYLANNLLECERPVLETDNMILELFSKNTITSTQIFNFSFLFDLDDLFPVEFLQNMLCEEINVYFDMYYKGEKLPVKDIYSNYEFIPKYDITKTTYNNEVNVLDYMQDYNSTALIPKNKLVQNTFHWALLQNQKSIFNLYNGFAPCYDGVNSTKISCNEPDLYTDNFDIAKNPYGLFKINDLRHIKTTEPLDLSNEVNKHEENYTNFVVNGAQEKEYITINNVLFNRNDLEKALNNSNLKVGVFFLDKSWSINTLNDVFGSSYSILTVYDYDFPVQNYVKPIKMANIVILKSKEDTTYAIVILNDKPYDRENKFAYAKLFFNALYINELEPLFNFTNSRKPIQDFNWKNTEFVEFKKFMTTLSNIFKTAKIPNDIVLEKSFYPVQTKPFKQKVTKEIELCKSDKFVELYRYSSSLIPMFVDIDDPYFKNRVYWVKQYNNTVLSTIQSGNDPDKIGIYSKYTGSKLTPVYPSIGYFPLNSRNIEYDKFYINDYYNFYKEKSWYKANRLFYLPNKLVAEIENHDATNNIDEKEINDALYNALKLTTRDMFANINKKKDFVSNYIKTFYTWTIDYEYQDLTNINKQKYTIKFILK